LVQPPQCLEDTSGVNGKGRVMLGGCCGRRLPGRAGSVVTPSEMPGGSLLVGRPGRSEGPAGAGLVVGFCGVEGRVEGRAG
jgi:hypothetical protein